MTMSSNRPVMSSGDEYWEACARHEGRQTSRNLATIFLCDQCTGILVRDCFNGRYPVFQGDWFDGFCGLCNQAKPVALTQWFICNFCLTVVRSYPKAVAATQFVHSFWESHVRPSCPQLKLVESDIVRIEAYVPRRRTQRAKLVTVERLDFLVLERQGRVDKEILHIELKAGPSSVDEMSEFQLDVNDFVDIQTVTSKTGLPAYIFHVQITEEYRPPTSRTIARAMWWTDVLTLRENLKVVRQRRGEEKNAGYYHPQAFRPGSTFVTELSTGAYRDLAARIRTSGIPPLPTP